MTVRSCGTAAIVVVLGIASAARAHDFRPGVLSLSETEPGVFLVGWTEPVDAARPLEVRVRFPSHCEHTGNRLECGERGLTGEITFPGLSDPRVRVVVVVTRLDGDRFEAIASGSVPRISLDRPGSSLVAWIHIGSEHVIGGLDHLAFVLGLLLVVGLHARRLAATITAFTVGHSITLALATLGVVQLASAPVEATIAASVLLVAREGMPAAETRTSTGDVSQEGLSLSRQTTVTRRFPWLVAGLFGLVHGLGFAGALAALGLPEGNEGAALLGFNVGVELGQLAVVALAATLVLIARRARSFPQARARVLTCYVLGAFAAWWVIDRTLGVITGAS